MMMTMMVLTMLVVTLVATMMVVTMMTTMMVVTMMVMMMVMMMKMMMMMMMMMVMMMMMMMMMTMVIIVMRFKMLVMNLMATVVLRFGASASPKKWFYESRTFNSLQLRFWMSQLELEYHDLLSLFEFLDNGDGEITLLGSAYWEHECSGRCLPCVCVSSCFVICWKVRFNFKRFLLIR